MIVILGQENELREFLKSCTQLGYGKTRKDAMGIVESVAVDKGVLVGTKNGGEGSLNVSQGSHCSVVTVLLMYKWVQ